MGISAAPLFLVFSSRDLIDSKVNRTTSVYPLHVSAYPRNDGNIKPARHRQYDVISVACLRERCPIK